jgi:hypothetical protein
MGWGKANIFIHNHYQVTDGHADYQGSTLRLHKGDVTIDTLLEELDPSDWADLVDAAKTSWTAFDTEATSAWGSDWSSLPSAIRQDARIIVAEEG